MFLFYFNLKKLFLKIIIKHHSVRYHHHHDQQSNGIELMQRNVIYNLILSYQMKKKFSSKNFLKKVKPIKKTF